MISQNLIYDTPTPGFTWPILPNAKVARQLALLNYLEQSQWFAAEKIRQKQFEQLRILFQHINQYVPYYRENGYTEFLPWNDIPILTRSEVQQNNPKLKAEFLPPIHGDTETNRTSGSTGKPILVVLDHVAQFFWNGLTLRHFFSHGYDVTKKMALIHKAAQAPPPHGRELSSWGAGTLGIIKTGNCYELDYCDPEEQLAWLLQVQPDYLFCFPTVLRSILALMTEKPAELQNLQCIGTMSEVVDMSLRQKLKNTLGIPLIDVYSAMEFGAIASQCPQGHNYHVNEENVILEVLNDANQACKPGEIGRIVITGLHNFAMPLIRYEIGDYAEVGEKCSCGRSLLNLKRVLGRERNMLVLPKGGRRWPAFTSAKGQSFLQALRGAQFQIIQRSLFDIEIAIVRPAGKLPEAEITPLLQEVFGYEFHFIFNYVAEIPRSANGKFEDFKSEVVI